MSSYKEFIDKKSIMQVLGGLLKKPLLLKRTDKYNLDIEDFGEEFYKILYGAINNLSAQGLKKIELLDLENYLSSRPTIYNIYNKNKGSEYVKEILDLVDESNFDYYYNRIKKMTLLRVYEKYGIDVRWLYNPSSFDLKTQQQQEDWFDKTDISLMAQQIDDRINNIKSKYLNSVTNEGFQAGDNIFELINDLKKSPAVGIPMYGKYINTITRGARLKKFYLRSAASGKGKAIPNDTLIPTPIGWRKVGDIKEGDYLFGQDGCPTKVLKVHPQPEQKNIWKVHFADGRVAECCGEHLWEYRYDGEAYRIEDTQTIYNRALNLNGGFRKGNEKSGYRFFIKTNEPVQYKEKQYSLPPYVMGAFLGDGSFRYDTTNKSLTFSSENDELPLLITKELGKGFFYQRNSRHNFSYVFKHIFDQTHPIWVEEFLNDYPKLWNVKSANKFIPRDYLMGSIEQRFELLQGLMDTDGTIDNKGRLCFTTVSSQLRDDVIELCHSLGFIVNYGIDKRKEKYTTGECYNLHIQCEKQLKPKLFRLQRKLNKAIAYANTTKKEKHKDHLAIVNIEKTEEKTDMTCFTVDNKDHLFLTNDFIVTHNTRSMIADACTFSCGQYYDIYEKKWTSEYSSSEPTLYISTEQELDEIQTMMLAFLSGVPEDEILNGFYVDDEEERVLKAAEILQQSPLWVETLPDFSLEDIENTIRKHNIDNNVHYVCHDYIHTSLKILEEIGSRSGVKLREDNVLYMLGVRLKDLCNELNIFILSATQLNGNWEDVRDANQNLLRGAKSLADKIDIGYMGMPVTEDDSKALESLLSSQSIIQPNLSYHIYKNRRGKFNNVKLWCNADLGTCRINPLFATTNDYELIPIEDLKIKTINKNKIEF